MVTFLFFKNALHEQVRAQVPPDANPKHLELRLLGFGSLSKVFKFLLQNALQEAIWAQVAQEVNLSIWSSEIDISEAYQKC